MVVIRFGFKWFDMVRYGSSVVSVRGLFLIKSFTPSKDHPPRLSGEGGRGGEV